MGIFGRKPNIEKLKGKRDIEGLIKACKHKDFEVSSYADLAITQILDESELMGDVETIMKIYNEGSEQARTWAIIKLGDLKDKGAVEPLIEDLRKEPSIETVCALGEIGDKRAVEPLIEVLGKKKYGYRVRTSAVMALSMIKDKKAVKPLIEAFENFPDHALFIIYALGELGDERAVEPLMSVLKDYEKYSKYDRGKTIPIPSDFSLDCELHFGLGTPSVREEVGKALEKIQKKQRRGKRK